MEWKQYIEFVQNDPSVMVFRMGWVADFADAYNFFDVLRGGGGNNYTRWANPTYDASLDKALNAATEADRFKIYSDMEEILSVQDMPVAPVYWYTNPDLVKTYVSGYEPNALGETDLLEGRQDPEALGITVLIKIVRSCMEGGAADAAPPLSFATERG